MTDDRAVREHPLAIEFDNCVEIDPPWQSQMAAEGAYEETHLAALLPADHRMGAVGAAAVLPLVPPGQPGHDLGRAARMPRTLLGESDPPLLATADVPDRMLPPGFDPDELLVYTQAYAGQIGLLDTCLGGFLEVLDRRRYRTKTLLAVTAPRGFPMGEHCGWGRAMKRCTANWSSAAAAPLSRSPRRSARSQALVEPADLWRTLLDWWPKAAAPPSPTGVSLMPLVQSSAPPCATGWSSRAGPRTGDPHARLVLRKAEPPELYVKPDDLWEVNDVANRCQDVVECLLDAADQYEQTIYSGNVANLPALSDVLVEGLE